MSSVVMMKWMIILLFAGNGAAVIVSWPHEYYVLQGNQGMVKCHNRSDDNGPSFRSHIITNAVWYRDFENGTRTRIGDSGQVSSDRYHLRFSPTVREVDEGIYFCCMPKGWPCGNSSTSRTAVKISTPPKIMAASSTHTSFIGRKAVLTCNIIDQGVPPAAFSWRRNGHKLTAGEYSISKDSAKFKIELMNLTIEDAGVYTCEAAGILAHRSDSVQLIVKNKTGVNNITTQVVHLQVLIRYLIYPCKIDKNDYLDAALHHHIKKICNCTNFVVRITLLCCIDNNTASYTVNITSPMVDNITQLWFDHKMHNPQGTNIGIGVISTWNNYTCFNDHEMSRSVNAMMPGYLIGIITALCVAFTGEYT